jgi:uncharacterized membrane protein
MKPVTQAILIVASITVLVVAILNQKPEPKVKEPFKTDAKEIGMGVGFGVVILLIIMGLFYMFYSFPKAPNVLTRKINFYNLE